MRVSIVQGILIAHILSRRGNTLRNNDTHNEAINTQNTCHDNGDNVFDNTRGMINTHMTNTETSTPCPPRRTPTTEDHTKRSAQVAAVVVLLLCVCVCFYCCVMERVREMTMKSEREREREMLLAASTIKLATNYTYPQYNTIQYSTIRTRQWHRKGMFHIQQRPDLRTTLFFCCIIKCCCLLLLLFVLVVPV